MAKAPTPHKASTSHTKKTPETKTNQNVDVSRLLELTKEASLLEPKVEILKKEIDSLQKEIDINNPKLEKLDKRKSEYKTLKNNIILAIESIKLKREELNKKNLLLKSVKLSISEIANISASKNVPKEANPEDVERIAEKTKQIENQKRIKELAEKFDDESNHSSFTDADKKLINTESFKTELKKIRQEKDKIESIRRKIAQKEVEGANLDMEEQIERDILLFNDGEKEKIEALKDKIKSPKEEAKNALVLTRRLLAHDTTLTDEEKKLEEKYHTESRKIIDKENKDKEDLEKNIERLSTIVFVKDEDKLPDDERLFNANGELNIEVLKKRISSDDDKIFIARNPGEIDKIILKVKEEKDKEAKAKKDAIEEEGKKKRDAFKALDSKQRSEKRAMAMERYQGIVNKKIKEIEDTYGKDSTRAKDEIEKLRNSALEKRNGRDDFDPENENYNGSHHRKMNRYNQNSQALREIYANKDYQKLASMDPKKMSFNQKMELKAFNERKEILTTNLSRIGPSGTDFVNLEEARAKLAKSSQEYAHSFESKFFGSKILAGITNMFGFKWSGIKEGHHTEHAKHEMHHAQEHYNKIRQRLMQNFVSEEHAVRKVWKQENIDISIGMEGLLSNVKQSFVDREYEKLDDLKHILEDSVKKPAFEKFAKWYKNKYWNWIKNERARTVAKRLTNALVLGGVLAPFSAATAGAVLSYKLARAGVSGVIGESAAAGVAGIFGGKKNAKGEFLRFANMRDKEFKKHEDEFVRSIFEQIRSGEDPKMNQQIMNRLNTNHENAIHQMQRRENRVRKGEMWARILVGGGALYGLSQLDPDHVIMPGPNPEPAPLPPTDEIKLEGDFVLANPKGFIQTFMDLKEKMISDYANDPAFAGLSHDQIAEKLTETGHFDALTSRLMASKNLNDFMDFAKDNGFWKPEGWHNVNIDSGSVPAGSHVGMEMVDGNMKMFLELPNGEHINIDNNFNEALNSHLKGVTMIDSDHLGNRAPNPTANDLENTPRPGDDKFIDDGSGRLDDFEEGPQMAPAPSPDEINDALGGDIDKVINSSGTFDEKIRLLKQVSNPGDENQFYLNKGFSEKGLQGTMRGSREDITTEYYDDTGENYYYTEKYSGYEDVKGTVHDIKQSPMYKEYHSLKNNYETAQEQIRKIETEKLNEITRQTNEIFDKGNRASTEDITNPGPSVEDLRIQEENLLKQAGDAKYENWIDQAFGRDRILGGHVKGVNTDAWNRIKNDRIEDFLNDTKNPDDIYSSAKEEDFFDTIRSEVIRAKEAGYSVGIQENETVTHFVDRLADISAKIDGVRKVTGSR